VDSPATSNVGSPSSQRGYKGLPLPDGVPVERVGELGWNALTDLETPVMVLHAEAVDHNIATMDRYVRDAGVQLAPHAKTSLSRRVVEAQLAGGAWGMTAATVGQVRALNGWGVRRIVLANVLVDPRAIEWVGRTLLNASSDVELWCYVDSLAGVDLLERTLLDVGAARPLPVLLEVGYAAGRTGVRDRNTALAVARAAHASPALLLGGVAGYEGLMHHGPDAAAPAGLLPFLDEIAGTASDIVEAGLFEVAHPLVTAGGSSYFDQVCTRLGPQAWGPGSGTTFTTVLRSGCYVTHDHGMYHRTSPLDGRRTSSDQPAFRPALELLAHVLSIPETGLAIAGFGRRDVPIDDRLPVTLGRYHDGSLQPLEQLTVEKVNDQHAYLSLPHEHSLAPGDLLAFGISHPCGAFDRWPAMPLVDHAHRILGVVTNDM
jgi:D-serine deaminase-like pyridoxal phosphate-dependent protein